MNTNESLDAPLAGQFRSSPFYVALGAPVLASALSIVMARLCYVLLPLDAAKEQVQQINTMLLVGGGGGALTGAYGIVARGLAITNGKIKKLLPIEAPQTLNAGTLVAAPAEGATVTGEEDNDEADNLQEEAVLAQEGTYAVD